MRLNLGDDPAVILIATETGLDQDTVVGKLHRLWSWVSEHSSDGCMTGVTQSWVDYHLRTPGFASAMVKAGWLEAAERGIVIPKFDVHMSESAKKRAVNRLDQARKRQKDVREMSEESSDKNGTCSPSISNSLSNSINKETEWSWPENLDESCRAEWDEWILYKQTLPKRKRYLNLKTAQTALNRYAKHGSEWFLSALEKARISGWQGPVEPDGEYQRHGNGTDKKKFQFRPLPFPEAGI